MSPPSLRTAFCALAGALAGVCHNVADTSAEARFDAVAAGWCVLCLTLAILWWSRPIINAPMEAPTEAAPSTQPADDDADGASPLHDAVVDGDEAALARALTAGASVDEVCYYKADNADTGLTATMLAAATGQAGCLDVLALAGANVNRVNGNGCTPIMTAAGAGHVNCVDALVRAGADVDHADKSGRTAIIWAVSDGKAGCVDALMRAGADVNRSDKHGRTAIMGAAVLGHLGCIDSLVLGGADVGLADENGCAAISQCAHQGDVQCLEALLRAGADVNHTSSENFTPLMAAACKGYHGCVDALLRAGAELHHVNIHGQTALQIASTVPIRRLLERATASEATMSAARARRRRDHKPPPSSAAAEDGVEERARLARESEAAAKSEAELLASLDVEAERSRAAHDAKLAKSRGGGGGKKKHKRQGGGDNSGRGGGGAGALTESSLVDDAETPPPPPVGLASVAPTPPPVPAPLRVCSPDASITEGGGPRDEAAAPLLCEFDPPLGAFMAHLGLLQARRALFSPPAQWVIPRFQWASAVKICLSLVQHMPLLVGEELSLDVLRLMRASGELETSLTELGLTRGARFKIAHGLRALYDGGDIGTGAVVCANVHVGASGTVTVGSLAVDDVPAHFVVSGSPARPILKRLRTKLR